MKVTEGDIRCFRPAVNASREWGFVGVLSAPHLVGLWVFISATMTVVHLDVVNRDFVGIGLDVNSEC